MINDLVNVEITILPPHEESNDAPKIYRTILKTSQNGYVTELSTTCSV